MTTNWVLIVEDEPVIRSQLALILDEMGLRSHQVGTVGGARAALEGTGYDIVILDLGLDDGSGLTLLEQFDRLASDALVLVVSSTMDFSVRARCYTLGARDFITKPFHPQEFKRRLQRLVNNRKISE